MAKDFENQIKDAIIAILNANPDLNGITIKGWRDASKKKKYPVILVHCTPSSASPLSPSGPLLEATVEIAVKTYIHSDKDGAQVNLLLGYVRDTVFSPSFPAQLTAAGPLNWHGVDIESGAYESDNDDENTMSVSINCFVQF